MMHQRKQVKKTKPKYYETPIFEENMGVHGPIALHAFWMAWGKEGPTGFICKRDRDDEGFVFNLNRMMLSVCGQRRPDFESSLVVLFAAGDKTTMGDFFTLWDDFIRRRGMSVVPAHRAGLTVLQDYASPAELSPILVDMIVGLNRRGIFNDDPAYSKIRGAKVLREMRKVDVLLRWENPRIFDGEPG